MTICNQIKFFGLLRQYRLIRLSTKSYVHAEERVSYLWVPYLHSTQSIYIALVGCFVCFCLFYVCVCCFFCGREVGGGVNADFQKQFIYIPGSLAGLSICAKTSSCTRHQYQQFLSTTATSRMKTTTKIRTYHDPRQKRIFKCVGGTQKSPQKCQGKENVSIF